MISREVFGFVLSYVFRHKGGKITTKMKYINSIMMFSETGRILNHTNVHLLSAECQ